jgi:hypothetical protein
MLSVQGSRWTAYQKCKGGINKLVDQYGEGYFALVYVEGKLKANSFKTPSESRP